jgi:hypothetical protein
MRPPATLQVGLQIGNGDDLKVEHRCRQQDGRAGFGRLVKMRQFAGAPGGHHIGAGGRPGFADQRQIEAGPDTVGGFAGGQHGPHAVAVDAFDPLDGVGAGGGPTAVDKHLIARRQGIVHSRVHGHGHAFPGRKP